MLGLRTLQPLLIARFQKFVQVWVVRENLTPLRCDGHARERGLGRGGGLRFWCDRHQGRLFRAALLLLRLVRRRREGIRLGIARLLFSVPSVEEFGDHLGGLADSSFAVKRWALRSRPFASCRRWACAAGFFLGAALVVT
jgi:hypothetical protein